MNSITSSTLFAILSFLLYSLWGLFNGVVHKSTDPFTGLFYSSIGYGIAGVISLYFVNFQPKFSFGGFLESIFLGLSTGLEETIVVCCILQIDNGFTHS